MSLNYRRDYKATLYRRKVITISVVATVFLLLSGTILYIKFRQENASGNPDDDTTTEVTTAETTELTTTATTEEVTTTEEITTESTTEEASSTEEIFEGEYVKSDEVVDDSYFEDALFIGDSRTEGFMLYSSIGDIHAYCSKGLSISRIYEDTIVPLEDGRSVTVMDALQVEQYNKIYIMFGVNELGWPSDELFEEKYAKMVSDIKQLQPDAIIYVQNIIPISAARSSTDKIYNNENVYRFNAIIEKVCEDQGVVYLDVASALADENGALPADASTDGIHCNGDYCDIWLDYLRHNTYLKN